jgi:hypothetical protein
VILIVLSVAAVFDFVFQVSILRVVSMRRTRNDFIIYTKTSFGKEERILAVLFALGVILGFL